MIVKIFEKSRDANPKHDFSFVTDKRINNFCNDVLQLVSERQSLE